MTTVKKPTKRAAERAAAKRYTRKRKTYVLRFDDPELEDLEVRARSVSFGRFLDLLKLAAVLDDDAAVDGEAVAAAEGLFSGFAEALESWNLDDEDGTEVPATLDGLRSQDADFVMPMVMSWLDAVGAVDAPLGNGSNGGKRSLEAGIPMQAPS